MTLLSFIRANPTRPSPASESLANAGGQIPVGARLVHSATSSFLRPIVILLAYRAALKRLKAGVKGDLFDDPVLWAELKSVAWAEATGETAHIP